MGNGLLSIIVPVHNGEKHLKETLESLRTSLYHPTEFLLIDDGSTDGSARLCQAYVKRDARFRLLRQENLGTAEARNKGLSQARGEFIGFCDQDDMVHREFYANAIERMEQDASDICISSSRRFYETSDKRFRIYERQKDALYKGGEIAQKLLMPTALNGYITGYCDEMLARGTIWNCIIRKKLIDRCGIRFKKWVRFEDDWLFRIEALLCAERVSTLRLCGYDWRTNLQSESHRKAYVAHIEKKQAQVRSYVYKKMQENGLSVLALSYLSYQKCFDMIKILENETAVRRSPAKRRHYLLGALGELNTADVRAASRDVKKGEIRYRLLLHLLTEEKYLAAFYCNAFLLVARDMLYRLRLAYFIESMVNGDGRKKESGANR